MWTRWISPSSKPTKRVLSEPPSGAHARLVISLLGASCWPKSNEASKEMPGEVPSWWEDMNTYEYNAWPAATNKRDSFIARRGWSLPLHGRERGRATKRCFYQDLSDRV